MDVQAERRLRPVATLLRFQKLFQRYDLLVKRVLLAERAEACLLEQSLLGLHIDVRLEKPRVTLRNLGALEAFVNLRSPLLGGALKYGNDRIEHASPQAGGSAHDRSNRCQIGRRRKEANAGWPK